MKNKWILNNLLIAVAIVVAVVAGSYFALSYFTHHGEEIPVPDFYGMNYRQAQEFGAAKKMNVVVTDSVFVKKLARGAVYKQNPVPGSTVKEGRTIRITINAINTNLIAVPNLVGYSFRQAKAELSSIGLNVGQLIYKNDMATNNVLGQSIEPDTKVEGDTAIDLTLGLNPKDKTFVPSVIGMKSWTAHDVLQSNFLNISAIICDESVVTYADSLAAVVYKQYPEASQDEVRMGTNATIYLTVDEKKLQSEEPQAAENSTN